MCGLWKNSIFKILSFIAFFLLSYLKIKETPWQYFWYPQFLQLKGAIAIDLQNVIDNEYINALSALE